MNPKVLIGAVVLLLAIGAGLWAMVGGDAVPQRIRADDAALVALGADVYARECAACHGVRLEGQPNWRSRLPDGGFPAPPHDDTGHTWHHADGLLFRITRDGGGSVAPPGFKSNMPAFGDRLSDREIQAVLSYIKSRWPKELRARHDLLNGRAAEQGSSR
jgi:mono/diheme cytochrome c family protein